MFKQWKLGNREMIEPIEMPEGNRQIMQEVLAQNKKILEVNNHLIRYITLYPLVVVNGEVKLNEDDKDR